MAANNPISAVLVIILTIIFPPIGVFLLAGCGPDLFINIILTLCGIFPGHIHAFYLEYIYFDRRGSVTSGVVKKRAPGIFSSRVQSGGRGYEPVVAA